MLEFPEIVCIRKQLQKTVVGKRIADVAVEHKDTFAGTVRESLLTQVPEEFQRRLNGARVTKVENRSSFLLVSTDKKSTLLVGDLVGSMRFHDSDKGLPKKACLRLGFSDSSFLTVVVGLFGQIRVFTNRELTGYLRKWIGESVEPTSKQYTWQGFRKAVAAAGEKKISAKKFLTSCFPTYYVSGLGGGYVGEILYRAKIHPKRKLASLSVDEQRAYYRCIDEVVREAIKQGGRRSEKDLFGQPGRFVPHVCKDTLGTPCPECGAAIEKLSFEGGASYVCPGCQPL